MKILKLFGVFAVIIVSIVFVMWILDTLSLDEAVEILKKFFTVIGFLFLASLFLQLLTKQKSSPSSQMKKQEKKL